MKTIIVAFWERNPGSDKDSDVFRLSPGVMPILKEGRIYPLIFSEKSFVQKKKSIKTEKLSLIYKSIASTFLSVNYKSVIVVLSEELRKDFFELIKYRDWPNDKPQTFPSIPGEQFGEEDRIFILIQDDLALGGSPVRISVDPTSKDQNVIRLVNKFNMIFPN